MSRSAAAGWVPSPRQGALRRRQHPSTLAALTLAASTQLFSRCGFQVWEAALVNAALLCMDRSATSTTHLTPTSCCVAHEVTSHLLWVVCRSCGPGCETVSAPPSCY